MSAAATAAYVTSKGRGFTFQNGMCRFTLYIRQIRRFCGISLIRSFKYLPDLKFTHEKHLPCGQKD